MRKSIGFSVIAAAIALSPSLIKADAIYTIGDINNACTGCSAADADFSFGPGTLTLSLTNDEPNLADASQLLSAFSFVLSGATGGSLSSSNGHSIFVDDNGVVTDNGTFTTNTGVGWVPTIAGGTYTLDVLSGTGHAGPANTLIGVPGVGGVYTAANGSIADNSAHNPFLDGTLTFVFDIAGLDPATVSVTSASFQFGTGDGEFTPGDPCLDCGGGTPQSATPEPTSLILAGCGLLALGVLRRRKIVRG